MKKGKKIRRCLLLWGMTLFLAGCQIVEPEKRAYPLVIGLDWKEDIFQIYLGMARPAQSTGQGKEGGEQQYTGKNTLLLSGKNREEIQKLYDCTRELYLDPGHVQAVVFGNGLLRAERQLEAVLKTMEKDTSLGNSAYVFATENVENVMEQNGTTVESLGEFLTGIYEDRTVPEAPVTLGRMYRELHNEEEIPELPGIKVGEGQIYVEK